MLHVRHQKRWDSCYVISFCAFNLVSWEKKRTNLPPVINSTNQINHSSKLVEYCCLQGLMELTLPACEPQANAVTWLAQLSQLKGWSTQKRQRILFGKRLKRHTITLASNTKQVFRTCRPSKREIYSTWKLSLTAYLPRRSLTQGEAEGFTHILI